MKKIISALLVIIMLVSVVPTTVFAEEGNVSATTGDSETTIEDDGGLGSLISTSLEQQEESDENVDIENKILDVTVDNKTVTVFFNNSVECNIIVAVYDEDTNVMLGSGMGTFVENTEQADIVIDIAEMPEYFVIKAYLLDTKNNPLHSSFESIDYTKAHQEFLATTINDFEADDVIINYDEAEDNNFAVFNKGTILIYETDTANKRLAVDVETFTYSFENSDSTLKELRIGDVFYYTAIDGDDIAGKVASITIENDIVTIVSEEDVALDEVFSFVKIDTVSDGYGSEFDTSSSDEGVFYEGAYSAATYAGVDISTGLKHAFSIDKKFGESNDGGGEVKIEGELSLGVNLDLKIELYLNRFSAELSLKEELELSLEVTGKVSSNPITLGTLNIPTGIPSVSIKTNINLVVEISVKLKFEATQEATIGFKYDSNTGYKNTSKPSKVDTDIQIAGKFYFGLQLDPQISVLCGAAEIGVDGELGVEVEVKTRNREDTSTEKHQCGVCAEGTIYGVFNFKTKLKFKLWKLEYKQEIPVLGVKLHFLDFYVSDKLGIGEGKCPNNAYKVTITVVDSSRKPISGASVGNMTTNSNGTVSNFYMSGNHTLTISKSNYKTQNYSFTVSDQSNVYIVVLNKTEETVVNSWNTSGTGNVIYAGNGAGKTKVYFYDSYGYGDVYAYTYKYLSTGGVDEALGVWPGTPCKYEGANIWSIDMPNSCTHILFNSRGMWQTNDIPNPGKTMIAVRGSGYEFNDIGGYNPIYVWREYGVATASISLMSLVEEFQSSTDDETTTDEAPVIIEDSVIVNDLIPGEPYVFMMLKCTSDKYTVDTNSLVYITDATADEVGTVEFTYYYEAFDDPWIGVVFGSCNHNIGDWETIAEASYGKSGVNAQFCTKCDGVMNVEEVAAWELPDLAFSGASLTLQDNLCINFKANENLFTEVGYENPYVIFELNGEEYIVTDYEVVSGKYVFDFSDISPANMNDTVRATLYATFDGVEYASETREYSVATYCYNMLSKYNTDDYVELRTLLVDLLNYGAQTQIYTNYNTDALVNAQLTEEQAAWGTSETPAYETVQNLAYKTIDNPTVQWKGGGLNLQDSVTMRFKISAESIENLTVIAETDTTIWTISAEEFEATTGGYYVFFDGLDASQMSEAVYLTVYDGDMPVSNTICYSIESYAYSKQSSTDTNLVNLLEAMMKYGNSASAYVN